MSAFGKWQRAVERLNWGRGAAERKTSLTRQRSDHHEVAIADRQTAGQCPEVGGGMRAVAVIVVEEPAIGVLVDDALVCVGCRCADDEGAGVPVGLRYRIGKVGLELRLKAARRAAKGIGVCDKTGRVTRDISLPEGALERPATT